MLRSEATKFGKFAHYLSSLLSLGSGLSLGDTPRGNARGRRPTGLELRNPADPAQAERIRLAQEKRERKGRTLMANTGRATIFNRSHENSDHQGYQQTSAWAGGRLNPLFVNR